MQFDADDTMLIESSRNGDLRAFSALVLRHQASVRACLAVRMNNPHDAEDLAQEVFVLAFNKLSEFDSSRPLNPWLRGIALNLLRNYQRKMRPLQVVALDELETLVNQELESSNQSGGEAEWYAAMHDCLDRLDADSKRLVKDRYEEDIDVAELCRRSGKKHSAVTMSLHRIRLQLRSCVENSLDLA